MQKKKRSRSSQTVINGYKKRLVFEFLRRAGLNRLRAGYVTGPGPVITGYAKLPKLLNRWCCSVACSVTTRIGHNRLRFGPGFS